MKQTILILLAMLIAGPLSRAQAQDKVVTKGPQVEEVKKIDHHLSRAMEKGDIELIDKHTADHYMLIDPVGNVHGKKKSLAFIKDKKVTYDSIKDSDVKTRIYGQTAVLTGLAEIKGKTEKHDISGEYRWTRVYAMLDGRWQCVTEHLTFVHDPEKLKK
jgi:ketosteroid isomerase-like protein